MQSFNPSKVYLTEFVNSLSINFLNFLNYIDNTGQILLTEIGDDAKFRVTVLHRVRVFVLLCSTFGCVMFANAIRCKW
jgi:hypothetical protein